MASSNRGLLIGCVAVGVLGGGCVATGVVGAAAWFVFQRSPDAAPPIAMPSFDPVPAPAPVAPVAVAPAPDPVITPPGVVAPGVAPVAPVVAPTPVAPVAPVAALRTIRIESTPSGARVMDGSAQLGTTPMDFPFPSGSPARALRLMADGYDPADIQLSEASSTHMAVALTRSAPSVAVVRPSGSSGSSSSGSSSSGSSGSHAGGGTTGESRPVAATIRPVGGGTTGTSTTGGTGTGTGGTTRPARPARTGTLSHDDF